MKQHRGIWAVAAALVMGALVVVLGSCSSSGSGSAASSSTSASATSYTLIENGKLTIGCSPEYKPMEYLENGEYTGFTVDLMNEVCKRLGLEANWLAPQNFDSLVTQVAAGTNMDVAASSITITPEREETVLFSDPYYDSNLAIVVAADTTLTSKDDLTGITVSAQQGSTGEEWVKENCKDCEYVPFVETPDALAALTSNTVQAVVYDYPVASTHVSENPDLYKILDAIATGEQYGIIINKNNPGLQTAINGALAEMKADGTLDALVSKWT